MTIVPLPARGSRHAAGWHLLQFAACGWMAVSLLALRVLLWRVHSTDTDYYFLPWHDLLIRHGRILALKQPISDYFPSFFELTALTSLLEGHVSRLGQIKLLPFGFDLLTAVLAFFFVAHLQSKESPASADLRRRVAGAFVILAGPTVILNGSVWGQTDIVFTFWLLLTVYCCCAGRGALASLAYGIAFAFKLQSVFLGPFYLGMLLRRRVPWWSMVWLPVGWLLALTPPLLVGGSPWPFLRLPFTQTNELNALAINFANPWEIANVLHVPPVAGVRIGMTLTVLAGLAIAALGLRPGALRPRAIAAVAALSLLAMPYVMPRMHDRYYFPAEILLSMLACVDVAYLLPAGLVASASLLSYVGFFTSEKRHPAMAVAVVGTSLALLMVSRGALALTAGWPAAETEAADVAEIGRTPSPEGHVV